MKNFKVKSLIDNFTDKVENVQHNKNDVFYCTKERYEFLKEHKAVELIEIIDEEIKENKKQNKKKSK